MKLSPETTAQRGRATQGFTLIELMIVVAIVAILAAVGYPAYTEHVQRSRRAEAQAVLLQAAQFMQRFYAAHNRYNTQLDGTTAVALPGALQRSPATGTQAYAISLQANTLTAGAFTLVATPQGPQASDTCGNLTLTHTGTKGVSGANATVANCWR